MYEPEPYSLKIYRRCKLNFLSQGFRKLLPDRQTDTTKIIHHAALRRKKTCNCCRSHVVNHIEPSTRHYSHKTIKQASLTSLWSSSTRRHINVHGLILINSGPCLCNIATQLQTYNRDVTDNPNPAESDTFYEIRILSNTSNPIMSYSNFCFGPTLQLQ